MHESRKISSLAHAARKGYNSKTLKLFGFTDSTLSSSSSTYMTPIEKAATAQQQQQLLPPVTLAPTQTAFSPPPLDPAPPHPHLLL